MGLKEVTVSRIHLPKRQRNRTILTSSGVPDGGLRRFVHGFGREPPRHASIEVRYFCGVQVIPDFNHPAIHQVLIELRYVYAARHPRRNRPAATRARMSLSLSSLITLMTIQFLASSLCNAF